MSERKRQTPNRTWSPLFFEEEARACPTHRALPGDAPVLHPGDRVSFDLGMGVDGPDFATNVIVLDSGK